MIDAQEAYRINLVNKVVPQDELMDAVDAFCAKILNKSSLVLEFIKREVDHGSEMDLNRAIQYDAAMWGVITGTSDKTEGMKAFLEKRDPVWSNE